MTNWLAVSDTVLVFCVQGYKALLTWKELCADQFNIRDLVSVLRQCNMEDIAEAATELLDSQYS